jgi:uncharacterized protein
MTGTDALAAAEYVALTTYRRDGSPVTTPVWAAPRGDALVVYTPLRSGKVRRVRRNDRVTVAVCDFDGHHRGPVLPGTARVLPAGERRPAERALAGKYGWRFHWFRLVTLIGRPRAAGGAPVVLEIRIVA